MIRKLNELPGSLRQRQAAEEGVGRRPAGGGPEVLGDRVDAENQGVGMGVRLPQDEGSVTGAEVDVDRREARGGRRQSSTVHPALVLA